MAVISGCGLVPLALFELVEHGHCCASLLDADVAVGHRLRWRSVPQQPLDFENRFPGANEVAGEGASKISSLHSLDTCLPTGFSPHVLDVAPGHHKPVRIFLVRPENVAGFTFRGPGELSRYDGSGTFAERNESTPGFPVLRDF